MEVIKMYIWDNYNVDISDDINKQINDDFNVSKLSKWELLDSIHIVLSRYYPQIKPNKYVLEYIPKFLENGNLTFITARHQGLSHQTEMWFLQNFGKTFKKHLVYTINKGDYIRKNNIKILVEDRIKYVNQSLPFVEKIYLIDKPWNSGFKHEKVEVVDNIKDVYERIENGQTKNY